MKKFKYIIAALSLILCTNVAAETRYVNDNIFIYMHSGPGLNYRIVGTIKAGTHLSTLKYDSKTKFTQIKTPKGKVAWVKSDELQTELPAVIALPKVKKQLEEALDKLANIAAENAKSQQDNIQSITDKGNLIVKLQNEKKFQQETIDQLKSQNLEYELQQDTAGDRLKMEWLLYGGYVLFGGVLLGLVVPFLPRPRKRSNNW